MLLAAIRRFVLVVLLASGFTATAALLIGALLGGSLDRSLALGFYLVGSFLLLCGFFLGNRGPARVKSESARPAMLPFGSFGARQLRWATPGEQTETIMSSAVFISLGITLIVIGTLIDSRHSLF
jgi:hypothetical protein